MRILLAEDHAMRRSGLRRIIADAFPEAQIAEVSSCEELLDCVRESDWSVLVLNVALGERNSLDLVPELRALRRQLPIVVLSMYKERPFVIRAMRAGVAGYVTKDRAPGELLEAIRAVLQHKRYLSESVASQSAEYVALGGSGSETPHELLSAREYEVFLALAEAQSVSARGAIRFRDRRAAGLERQDHQHLPHADPGEAGPDLQRPTHPLRPGARISPSVINAPALLADRSLARSQWHPSGSRYLPSAPRAAVAKRKRSQSWVLPGLISRAAGRNSLRYE